MGYATEHEWVLLTADDDFFDETIPHGLLYYEDENPPSPRALGDAIQAIDSMYERPTTITEWVPDGWV